MLLAVGLAVGFARRLRPPSRGRALLAGPGAGRRWSPSPLVAGVDRAASRRAASRQSRAGLTDPEARTPANTPNRLTATASVRARYWDEAFKVHADLAVARRRRRRLRDRAQALPHRRRRRPARARLRRADARRPRLGRPGRSRWRRCSRGCWRRRGVLGLRRATAGCRGTPSASAGDAGHGRARLRRPLADRLDLVRPRQRGRGAALRRLGGRAAAAARAAARRGPDRRRRRRRARRRAARARRASRLRERLARLAAEPVPHRAGGRRVGCSAMAVSWTIVQPLRAEHAGDAVGSAHRRPAQYAAAADIALHRARAQPAVRRALVRAGGRRRGAGRPHGAPSALLAQAVQHAARQRGGVAPAGRLPAVACSATRRRR